MSDEQKRSDDELEAILRQVLVPRVKMDPAFADRLQARLLQEMEKE
jgi:hypothetical protein